MGKDEVKFSIIEKIGSWIRRNRGEAIILAAILLVGAFFRLYRIDEYLTFLGDEGRDVIAVRRLLVNGDLILVGPGTSIGNIYLGPLYYYLMAPALFLANFSPVGPAAMIALLGIVTIYFVWYVGREWFGKIAGFVAAGLYAISPAVIVYSRSSWNPNIMPFFSLLCIYSIWKIWVFSAKASEGQAKDSERLKWLIVLGISYAFVLQSHYLGLLLAPVIAIFWLLTLIKIARLKLTGNWKVIIGNYLRNSLLSVAIFAGLMSPLVVFDARHGWKNFTAIKTFFTQRQTTVSARPWNAIPKIPEISTKVVNRLVTAKNENVGKIAILLTIIAVVYLAFALYGNRLRRQRFEKSKKAFCLLLVWLGFALVGLGVYKQEIYDHYYGFFFSAPFLFIGGLAQHIVQSVKNKGIFLKLVTYCLLLVALTILIAVNLRGSPLKDRPNRQLQRTIEVSQKIVEESTNNKFNLAVIAERNYEGAYQYFLESWNTAIVMIDPQKAKETITEQLFVVCELPKEACDPTHNPKAQVANFGWSKVENSWEVGGVILYKLIHYQ